MIIELTTFRLRAGADEAGFLDADAAVQTGWAYQQRGLVRRTTARSGDGAWLVSTSWYDLECLESARDSARTDQHCLAAERFVETASRQVRVYETLD